MSALLLLCSLFFIQPIPLTYAIYTQDPNDSVRRKFHIYGVVSTLGFMYFGYGPAVSCFLSFMLAELYFRLLVAFVAYGS